MEEKNYVYIIEDEELGDVEVSESKLTRAMRARDEKKAIKNAKLAAMSDKERKAYKRNRIIGAGVVVTTVIGAIFGVTMLNKDEEELSETASDEPEDNIVPFDAEWHEVSEEKAVSE